MTNDLTPANITTKLAFDKRFDTYEENLEKQSKLKKDLNLIQNQIYEFLRAYTANTGLEGTYRPYTSNEHPARKETFPPVYTFKVYEKFIKYEKFERYERVKTELLSDYLLKLLDEDFPGIIDRMQNVQDYFHKKISPNVDEVATKALQEKYTKLLALYDLTYAELEEVQDHVTNMERYVGTADKIARIGRNVAKDEE